MENDGIVEILCIFGRCNPSLLETGVVWSYDVTLFACAYVCTSCTYVSMWDIKKARQIQDKGDKRCLFISPHIYRKVQSKKICTTLHRYEITILKLGFCFKLSPLIKLSLLSQIITDNIQLLIWWSTQYAETQINMFFSSWLAEKSPHFKHTSTARFP